ncbi:hypothetical protein [Micromonospora maritima]|uniref:hypothetical protein n=1 Tax=Micromonospora maritima TaxID=986711 RepID=UPI00157C1CA0|nr:hypothetical protein [Micromonospora maritima]
MSTPWGAGEHPADWAYRTGRVTAESREQWRTEYDANPTEAGAWLAELFPILADPTLAKLQATATRLDTEAENAELAHLFPPTDRTPAELGEHAGLFPPAA